VTLVEYSVQEKDAEMHDAIFSRDDGLVAYRGLTLRSPRSNRTLIEELSIEIPRGCNVLVQGADETARAALFHATVGLWEVSHGCITRPGLEHILMLPELPYVPPCTLRDLLLRPWPEEEYRYERKLGECQVPEESIRQILSELKLTSCIDDFGLDERHQWENDMPLAELKLLVIARALLSDPAFVFLDRPGSTLSPAQISWILGLFRQRNISYVVFVDRGCSLEHFDVLLELGGGGGWQYEPIKNAKVSRQVGQRIRA
jgi:vitamin B12/bleomycin/antimicrobial peptide transport system ATP-binding/permease protein